MNVLSGSNAVYSSADGKLITLDIVTDTLGAIPISVQPNDPPTAQIYADCIAGKYGAIGAYVVPPPQPNPSGFSADVKIAVGGILATNALMALYPAFLPAIQQQNWSDVSVLLADALTKGIITSAQNTAIRIAATTNGIILP